MRIPKKFIANLFIILLSTFIALICAEIILRFLYPQQLAVWYTTRDGMVIHPPNTTVSLTKFDQKVRFNSFGMRDREHPIEKPDGTFRVLLLGDSFMEALQVSFEESFPYLLEKRLQEALHQPVEVINAAVSGWGTDAQLTYLKRYAYRFKPDLILVAMTLHNDVLDNQAEEFHILVDGKPLEKPIQKMPFKEYALLKVKDFLASHSHLFQLVRKFKYRKTLPQAAKQLDYHLLQLVHKDNIPRLNLGWEFTYQLFQSIQETGRALGAETVVFLIPLSIQLYEEALTNFLTTYKVSREQLVLQKPQQMMQKFGKEAGIEIIDLWPAFYEWTKGTHKNSLHVRDGHWNPQGHRIAADVVAQELLYRKLLMP